MATEEWGRIIDRIWRSNSNMLMKDQRVKRAINSKNFVGFQRVILDTSMWVRYINDEDKDRIFLEEISQMENVILSLTHTNFQELRKGTGDADLFEISEIADVFISTEIDNEVYIESLDPWTMKEMLSNFTHPKDYEEDVSSSIDFVNSLLDYWHEEYAHRKGINSTELGSAFKHNTIDNVGDDGAILDILTQMLIWMGSNAPSPKIDESDLRDLHICKEGMLYSTHMVLEERYSFDFPSEPYKMQDGTWEENIPETKKMYNKENGEVIKELWMCLSSSSE